MSSTKVNTYVAYSVDEQGKLIANLFSKSGDGNTTNQCCCYICSKSKHGECFQCHNSICEDCVNWDSTERCDDNVQHQQQNLKEQQQQQQQQQRRDILVCEFCKHFWKEDF